MKMQQSKTLFMCNGDRTSNLKCTTFINVAIMGLPQKFPNIVLFQHPLSEDVFVGFVSDSQKLFFMFCKKISIRYNTSDIYI